MAAAQMEGGSTEKKDLYQLSPSHQCVLPGKRASLILGCANNSIASRWRRMIFTSVQHLQGCIWITVSSFQLPSRKNIITYQREKHTLVCFTG